MKPLDSVPPLDILPPFGTDADIIATRAHALDNAVPLEDLRRQQEEENNRISHQHSRLSNADHKRLLPSSAGVWNASPHNQATMPRDVPSDEKSPIGTTTEWLRVARLHCKRLSTAILPASYVAPPTSYGQQTKPDWYCSERTDTARNPFFCTVFTGLKAKNGEAIKGPHCAFTALGVMLAHIPTYKQKNKQPLIKLGRYENNSRAGSSKLVAFSGLELDHDAGTMTMAQVVAVLKAFGINHIIYPTYTSTSAHPKWRAFIQVSKPIKAKYRKAFVEVLSELLGAGVVSPESFRDKQIMFIGRKTEPDGYQVYGHYTAYAMDQADWLFDRVVTTHEQMEAEATKARLTLALKPKPVRDNTDGQIDVITAFNESYDVTSILLNAGYTSSGSRFCSPLSTSGLAGVNLLVDEQDGRERVYSHHSNCPLNNGYANDAFDCFQILEHGNNQAEALKAASRMLWHNGRTLEEHNGELFKQSRAADNLNQINPMAINVWGKAARALVNVPNGRQLFESWAGAAVGVMWANLTAKGALDAGVLYHLAKDYPAPKTPSIPPPPAAIPTAGEQS